MKKEARVNTLAYLEETSDRITKNDYLRRNQTGHVRNKSSSIYEWIFLGLVGIFILDIFKSLYTAYMLFQ